MADFRKWFPVLAIVALMMGTATTASAQLVPAFGCVSNAGVPPIVRAEGLTELVGDLILNCTGGTPTALGAAVPQVNFQIFLNTNVTSKWYDPWSEALLMIDEPAPLVQRGPQQGPYAVVGVGAGTGINYGSGGTVPNVYQGRQAADNSIAWLGVPIDPPGTTATRIIRITNVRANAFQLGVSSTLIPTQIVMFVSATGTTSIPINNPQQTVAFIQNGLSFALRKADDSDTLESTGKRLLQCVNNNKDLSTDNTKAWVQAQTFVLRFTEGFASSFKTIGTLTQNVPGGIFNTESGFTNSALSASIGVASQGTRLMAKFNNIPAGVVLYVGNGNYNTSGSLSVILTSTDANGAGGFSAVSHTSTSGAGGSATGISPLTITGGSATAVWEVRAADPLVIENAKIYVAVAYTANTGSNLPGLGTSTVNGSFAPLSTVGKREKEGVAPHPRFADTSTARNGFVVNSCATNILFPFVTNQAGFDTGMVISNTSLDPFGTSTQSGACKLNYYGETTGGGAAPAAQTSGSVAAGKQLLATLSSGGNLGIAATPGFQGYVIAQCAFQFAHGYAFISDVGAQRLAQGYLALILDPPVSNRDTGTQSESLGQ